MGRVYKAFDKEIKEKVALKLLSPEIATNDKMIERFRNELKLTRNVSHRNVCRMYDLNKEGTTHFITMEWVPGEDLKSSIRRIGALSIGKAIFIAKQICEGLSEAHRIGVVHRDLKPQNIMIDREGNARIMDFGIARTVESQGISEAGMMIGTPEYMSPEQVEGKEVDRRTDVYALGVVLYEMVTGEVPFHGDSVLSVAIKHKTEKPRDPRERNPQIPAALSALILKCMEKDKGKRYQRVEEIIPILNEIEKNLTTQEKAITASLYAHKTSGIRRVLRYSAFVILAAAILVAGYFALRGKIPTWLARESIPAGMSHSIAVISFENLTGEKSYDYLQEAIPNLLITSLEQSKYIHVTTWERLFDLLQQMGKKDTRVIDRDVGFELCRLDGIEAIVIGSFIKAGDMFATDVKVYDVNTKKLLKSASAKGKGVGSILEKQIDDLSKEISTGIGISERKIETAQTPIAEVTSGSLEAYNYFLRGRDDYEKFYAKDARQFLEKAIRFDPNFAQAYLYLAWTYGQLGEYGATTEAFEKAKALSGRVTDKERMYIEACYADGVEKNEDKAFAIFQEMAKKYPKEKRAHLYLGNSLWRRKLIPKAIEEFNKALELDPNYGQAMNMIAYASADSGDYEKAIDYFTRYAAISPGDANPFDSIAEIYFRMGRYDDAIAKYKEALEAKPSFGADMKIAYIYALKEDYPEAMKWLDRHIAAAPSQAIQIQGYIWKGIYFYLLGDFNAALKEFSTASTMAAKPGYEQYQGYEFLVRAYIAVEKGDFASSREYLNKLFDMQNKVEPKGSLSYKAFNRLAMGLTDLKEGKIADAKSKLAELEALVPKIDSNYQPAIKGYCESFRCELALAEGAPEKVIAELENKPAEKVPLMTFGDLISHNLLPNRDLLARAYAKKGELDKAIAEYERLTTLSPSRKERFLIYPVFHYRLAKLYEQKGLNSKAVQEYTKFLDLWKSADPGLPEPADAKKRLESLKTVASKSR
jgi:serine/threonine protein kinase/cytochrome c-type biogenesis protein CcmH/NrfG